MTMTADDYINRVLDVLPRTLPLRAQIAMELRGHIAERVDSGHAVDDVLRQLGDPVKLAESYLSAEPLVSASFGSRAKAKVIDVFVILAAMLPFAAIAWRLFPAQQAFPLSLAVLVVGGSFAFGFYTIGAEAVYGTTVGKRFAGLRVVSESGARITFGQAMVRQLSMFLQMYWIDIMFALFTEKSQRAFEVLSKTRVVVTSRNSAKPI